ncbi:MAG: hypothetical protein GF315_06855 [candidate division Zixibacteria bacterium]|nr:hypothetical protein [candidate division Zixibacteria bacterium]
MKALKEHRDGEGRWKRFPFYYTLLAINDINLPEAIDEMKYTGKVCERMAKILKGNDKYNMRRLTLMERILEGIR